MKRILPFVAALLAGVWCALASAEPAAGCKVTGKVVSSEYQQLGGKLERSIVWVYRLPKKTKAADLHSQENQFEFDLPPGDYLLRCTGNGSRGATFEPTYKTFTVKAGEAACNLGTIDMPASATTRLFGKSAPELSGAAAWKNTDPVTLKQLHGRVVLLDFWSYSCSICIHHMPDLAKLVEKHRDDKLVGLTIHDNTAETLEEVDGYLTQPSKKKLGSLPIALDGKGPRGIFEVYGIHAVPALILIDADGKVVRRFHHAGDPELEKAVGALLKK